MKRKENGRKELRRNDEEETHSYGKEDGKTGEKGGKQCRKDKGVKEGMKNYPFTPTRRWTDAKFLRFLTVLEYSPSDEKFLPTTAQRAARPVHFKEKNRKNFNTFCFKSLYVPT
jgi:hypothetical protein